MTFDPDAEDVAFALEPVGGVLSVMRLSPRAGHCRYVVELAPEGSTYASAHAAMRLMRIGRTRDDIEFLVFGTPPRWQGRLEPISLEHAGRERARARALAKTTRRPEGGCYVPRFVDVAPSALRADSFFGHASTDETLVVGPLQLAAASQHWFGPTVHQTIAESARRCLRSTIYPRILVDMATQGRLLHEAELFRCDELFLVCASDDVARAERAARAFPGRARILVRPLERERLPFGPFAPVAQHERLTGRNAILVLDPEAAGPPPEVLGFPVFFTRTLAGARRSLARNDFARVVVDARARTDGVLDYRTLWDRFPTIKARTTLLVSEARYAELVLQGSGRPLALVTRPLLAGDIVRLGADPNLRSTGSNAELPAGCRATARCARWFSNAPAPRDR